MKNIQKNTKANPMLDMLNRRTPSGDYFIAPSVAAAATSLYGCEPLGFSHFESENVVKVTPQPQLDLWQLNNQINTLNSRIEKLTSAIEQMNKIINPPIQQFLIEDIEFDRARELVVDYLKENKIASLSELAETLKIDLRMLSDIVGELQEEGLIKEKD
jgi:predicted transcriptional regulator